MAKKLNEQEKRDFIAQHVELVPANNRDKFFEKDVDKQYVLIGNYVRRNKAKTTLQGIVKAHLKNKSTQVEDVKEVISICNTWMEKNKTKLINDVDEQIKKLEEERKKLYEM